MPPPAGSPPAPAESDAVVREMTRQVVLMGVVMLATMALLMAVRRGAGALEQPLPGSSLLLVGLLLVLSAWGLRAAWQWASQRDQRRLINRFVLAAPTLSLLLIALTISLPASPAWGLILSWALIVGEETWTWSGALRGRATSMPPEQLAGITRARETVPPTDEAVPVDVEEPIEADAELELRQQVTRGIDATGDDVLVGTFHAPITADQRNADIHVAFCPPFAHTPVVEAYHVGGPACRVTVPQVFPYGARIDVRLSQVATEPTTVVLEVVARDAVRDGVGTE